jgi:enoyl-CoA hydratase/carnithine racemase
MSEVPVRLERDGNVAVMVLDNPPLNLFGSEAWQALVDCVDEVESSDTRAMCGARRATCSPAART